jgi:tricorn protease
MNGGDMKKILLITLFCILLFSFNFGMKDARLLRFPDINGDLIVFVYAGDLWSVSAGGGEARKLTTHPGVELSPKISPNGKWIAFSAEYSGSRQVFVMPSEGGVPRQLTFYNDIGVLPPRGGFDNLVMDWTPDSKKILFRSHRTPYGERKGKFFLVNLEGGLETPLKIPEAGYGNFSPDGGKICFTTISREFRTWKRYKGGMAADVWIYDLENNQSERITKFPGTDHIPMWFQNKIYFASDRDLLLNIHEYDINTKKIRKITNHKEFDVMWPSGDNGAIVYENGGYIYKLDLATGSTNKVIVDLHYDSPGVLPYFKNVAGNIYSYSISPTGKRAVFGARGDIFTVPAKDGQIDNLTLTQGIREIFPRWSADGKFICYYSDQTGEYEIYLKDQEGKNKAIQLTQNSTAWKFPAVWSPDSQKLLFSDKNQLLQVLDVKTKKMQVLDKASRYDIRSYDWSPDSNWVVYTKDGQNGQDAIWVYSMKQKKTYQLTNNMFNDYSPVFSTCGHYIFFRSDRDFNLSFSAFEFNYLYHKATRIYAMALRQDTPPLFKEKNDKESIRKVVPKSKSKSKKGKTKPEAKLDIHIDFENLNNRIVAFPMKSGDFRSLNAVKEGILYTDMKGLHLYNIDKKKDEMIFDKVVRYVVSFDKKKLLYRTGKTYGIVDIRPKQKSGAGKLDLTHLTMKIEPQKEWKQIYQDGWRIFRDWFYSKKLHGVDWLKMKTKYQQLVPYVGHRADLDYIFGELIGESNTGHCYVNWGDFPQVKRVEVGLLGAELKADKKSNRYYISKIYLGENWNEERRSPLYDQGVGVKKGDYIIQLNHRDVTLKDNPYQFLENTIGKRIPITVNHKPSKQGARTYMIKPIKSEQDLLYLDWVESRRKMVDELSEGKIGYIHVPNTSIEGNRELFRGMYAFYDKEALIIDERYNGGGFIPDVMTRLLERTTLSYWSRAGVKFNKTPGISHDGPKAMLINHYSSSGGDAFPYYFKKRKLGTLIGTRTWGGLVGLSGNAGFIDGGSISVPTFGMFDTEGKWAVEGIGVYPDIEVYDEPHLVAKGKDPSVEKAVEVLLEELKKNPPKIMQKPVPADRSKWIEKKIK